jgi:hypothetical protein
LRGGWQWEWACALQYLEDKLGAGYDGVGGILGVPVVVFESEKVTLLGTRENGHLR